LFSQAQLRAQGQAKESMYQLLVSASSPLLPPLQRQEDPELMIPCPFLFGGDHNATLSQPVRPAYQNNQGRS